MATDPVTTFGLHAEPTGQGIFDKMAESGDEPEWAMSYGGDEFAMSLGKSGALYVFSAPSGRVFRFQPRPS